MSPCLMQQIFRQKIGIEMDQELFDVVMFPLLLKQRHLPIELLLDIKLTRSEGDYVDETGWHKVKSVIAFVYEVLEDPDYGNVLPPDVVSISPFAFLPSFVRSPADGRRSSLYLRNHVHPRFWGTIDILNQLQGLKHPQTGRLDMLDQGDFENGYVWLVETTEDELEEMVWEDPKIDDFIETSAPRKSFRIYRQIAKEIVANDVKFVNDFLENCLLQGKRLCWGEPDQEGDLQEFATVLTFYE